MEGPRFERLVKDHERMVRALALSYGCSAHDADDVVQETFWRAYRSLDSLRSPDAVRTWLYRITCNTAVDHLRARKRRETKELRDDMETPVRRGNDQVDRIMAAVDGLREDYRRILLLRYVDRLSYAQIAETLEMTPTAVGEKLHRVRHMVQEMMTR